MLDWRLFIIDFFLAWPFLIYLALALGMMIEGEAVFFIAAYLAHTGFISFWLIMTIGYGAVIIGDVLWYSLGHYINRLPPGLLARVDRLARPFDRQLRTRPLRLIFLTKFTYGIHHAILIRSGMFRINFWRYLSLAVVANFIWVVFISFVSFVFGALAAHYLRYVEITLLVGLIIFILGERWLTRHLDLAPGVKTTSDN